MLRLSHWTMTKCKKPNLQMILWSTTRWRNLICNKCRSNQQMTCLVRIQSIPERHLVVSMKLMISWHILEGFSLNSRTILLMLSLCSLLPSKMERFKASPSFLKDLWKTWIPQRENILNYRMASKQQASRWASKSKKKRIKMITHFDRVKTQPTKPILVTSLLLWSRETQKIKKTNNTIKT